MNRALTEEQRLHYRRDGFLFPIAVLDLEQVRHYRAACDDLEARLGGKPRTVEVRQMHLALPWAYRLATEPRVLDAVEDLLGPNLLVWTTELFAKHPHDPAVSVAWHHDRPYMGFAGGATTSAWIALGDSTPANGCMRAAPDPDRRAAAEACQRAGRRAAPPEGQRPVVDVVLRPGQMSLHDADVLHGSGPNASAVKRVGFVVRYVTPDARPRGGRPPVLLARGRDDRHHFRIVEPPGERGPDRALADLKEAAALHLDAVLHNLRRTDES